MRTTAPATAVRYHDALTIAAIANVGIGAKDGTDIWGGLLAAIDATSTGDAGERRVIVLLTDGANDASSKSTIADVIAKAKQENVAIHAIGLGGQGLDSASLQQLTSSTGGSYREASGPAELATLYSDVQREIASTYYLGYRTEQSGRVSLTVSNGTSKATTIYDGGAAASLGECYPAADARRLSRIKPGRACPGHGPGEGGNRQRL